MTSDKLKEAISIEADLLLKLRALPEHEIFEFMQNLRGGTYFNMGMFSAIPVSKAYKATIRIYKVVDLAAIVSGVSYENVGTTKEFRDQTGEAPGHSWYDHLSGFENKIGVKKSDPNSKYVLWDVKKCTDTCVRYYVVDIATGAVQPVTKEDVLQSAYLTQTEKNKLLPRPVTGFDLTTGNLVENKTVWRTTAFDHIFWLSQNGKGTKEYGTRFTEACAELKEEAGFDLFRDANAHVDTDLDAILSGNVEEACQTRLKEDTDKAIIRCVNAWYEDDDGYICNVGIYAGDWTDDQIAEGLYEAGMMYVTVYDEYEKEVSAAELEKYQPGNVVDVFDVDEEVINAFAQEHGLDPEEYKHVGFFESKKGRTKSFLDNELFVDFQ